MIQLKAQTIIHLPVEEIIRKLTHLDKIYTKYCPKEHLVARYIKGNPVIPGSILYFEEIIGGKKCKLKYKVYSVHKNRQVILNALFPRSLFNIHAIINLTPRGKKTSFERIIQVGYSFPLLGKLFDFLILSLLGKKYYNAMVKHETNDLNLLKNYLEKN